MLLSVASDVYGLSHPLGDGFFILGDFMLKNQYELRICEVSEGQFSLNIYLKRPDKPDRWERGVGEVEIGNLMMSISDLLKCMSSRCRNGL